MALHFLKKRACLELPLMEDKGKDNGKDKVKDIDAKVYSIDKISDKNLKIAERLRNRIIDRRPSYYKETRSKSVFNVTPTKVEQTKKTSEIKAIRDNVNKHSNPSPTLRGKENSRRSAGSESPVSLGNSSPRRNVCKRCNERFQWKSALRKHEMFCMEIFKCDYCSYDTSDRMALSRHSRKHYPSVQLTSCENCGTVFNQSTMLWFHSNSGNCRKQQPYTAAKLRAC